MRSFVQQRDAVKLEWCNVVGDAHEKGRTYKDSHVPSNLARAVQRDVTLYFATSPDLGTSEAAFGHLHRAFFISHDDETTASPQRLVRRCVSLDFGPP